MSASGWSFVLAAVVLTAVAQLLLKAGAEKLAPMSPSVSGAFSYGMRIAVEFNDGEVIRGAAHYNPERNGFFLYPDDRTKNDRIFVVNSAIVSIEVEKL